MDYLTETGFTFLVLAYSGCLRKEVIKQVVVTDWQLTAGDSILLRWCKMACRLTHINYGVAIDNTANFCNEVSCIKWMLHVWHHIFNSVSQICKNIL